MRNKIKLNLVLFTILLALVSVVNCQIGGAKGAMRGRGKSGGRTGGGRRNSHNTGADDDDDDSNTYGNNRAGRPRPCIGLCYLRKLDNRPTPTPRSSDFKPCVGLCYLQKLWGQSKVDPITSTKEPCIGLCHREKLKELELAEELEIPN